MYFVVISHLNFVNILFLDQLFIVSLLTDLLKQCEYQLDQKVGT